MRQSTVKLHPDSYKKLETPLIFYISKSKVNEDMIETFVKALRDQKSALAISGRKFDGGEWRYSLLSRSFCMHFMVPGDHSNFAASFFAEDERARSRFDNPYTKMFFIEPAAGVYFVYGNSIYSVETGEAVNGMSWDMNYTEYIALNRQMIAYFESDSSNSSERKGYGRRFEANILTPFKNYTAKERFVEESKAGQNAGLVYSRREFVKKHDKGSGYAFYSNDPDADPEKAFFTVGNKITLFSSDGTKAQTGILYDIDSESADEVIFYIDFFFQTNDAEIPECGKLVMAYNDTQDKVREGVIKSMELSRIPSEYMYKTFADFSVDGYSEPKDDLVRFIGEKLKEKYPPNQMQLEAIIKGLLTKDMLLVLGPPGTGKTTVIGTWVEYFISQGKRVLISSQNNAAVDNVLERFKGSGEIVRLGQEAKVQENCREFLPFNKLRSMRTACENNNRRITAALDADLVKISAYREMLCAFRDIIDAYYTCKASWDNDCRIFSEHAERLLGYKSKADGALAAVEELLEDRSRKIIFLEECKKKNPIIRFFIKRQIRHAEDEIKRSGEKLESLREDYKSAVKKYNIESLLLRNCVDDMRRRNSYNTFIEARDKAYEFSKDNVVTQSPDGTFTGEYSLGLQSELCGLYRSVEFSVTPWENRRLVENELTALESLERSAEELKLAIEEWKNCVESGRNDIFEEILLGSCQIVGATCIGINSAKKFAHVDFDVAIVDESGQIQIHNALVPMSRAPITLMLGDYKQIPPCANDDVIAACENDEVSTDLLKMSFFEYLFESMRKAEISKLTADDAMTYDEARAHILKPVLDYYVPSKDKVFTDSEIAGMIADVTADEKKLVNLNSQFRMPGHISDIISEWFYENNYYSSYDMARFSPVVPGTDKPAVIVRTSDMPGRFEKQPANKMGYFNDREAELVCDIVEKVILAKPESERYAFCEKISEHIGIISAYGAQVRRIRECLKKRGLDIEESQIRGMVASLDSFQGQERPLIIYSLTRSKPSSSDPSFARVGFMKELRRLNVAFTRCKQQLVIIGDIDYLKECMYSRADSTEVLPCSAETDGEITLTQIDQCAECPVADCERKFARFMRLLMQHVTDSDSPAGNLIDAAELNDIMNGDKQ